MGEITNCDGLEETGARPSQGALTDPPYIYIPYIWQWVDEDAAEWLPREVSRTHAWRCDSLFFLSVTCVHDNISWHPMNKHYRD